MARKKSATIDLKVRMKEPLRAKLERAAKSRGVSLNAETVDRVERSFLAQDANHDVFGSKEAYELLRLLSMWATGLLGPKWPQDYDSCLMAFGAMDSLLRQKFGKEPIDTSKTKVMLESGEIDPFVGLKSIESFNLDVGRLIGYEAFAKAAEKLIAERD